MILNDFNVYEPDLSNTLASQLLYRIVSELHLRASLATLFSTDEYGNCSIAEIVNSIHTIL